MIPQVEEICGEAEILTLSEFEVLDKREIPVLLEGATVDVAAETAESRGAEVGIVYWVAGG